MSYFTKEDEIKIIQILEGEMEIYDDDKLSDKLYEYYMDDMPYGIQKARDGDPCEWIFEQLADEFAHLLTVVKLTEKDLENG